jgi:predicted DNA-binding protein (MmcQ/YjbR family)
MSPRREANEGDYALVQNPQVMPGVLMNIQQLKEFCRGFPGATETLYGEPYNFLVYAVGGKKFAYFKTSHPERWRFSTRVSPDRFIELTDVPGVKPARYRGRFHWITVVKVSSFPAVYLTELVEWSYQRALASMSKTRRTAIRASARTASCSCGLPPGKERSTRIPPDYKLSLPEQA